jgi:DNA-directed RNA polymerase subunit beta
LAGPRAAWASRSPQALEEWRTPIPNPEAAAPPTALIDKLKDIYGENYHADIDARTTRRNRRDGENLKNGVPMGTPVFDGAREADVTAMLDQGRSRYLGSGHAV